MGYPGRVSKTTTSRWCNRLLVALAVLTGLLLLGVIALWRLEWKPPPHQLTARRGQARRSGAPPPSRLDILSWNIGYAALDREADFFMDGGRGVRARNPEQVQRNLAAVAELLRRQQADIIMLQEIDRDSSRTFALDQVERLATELPGYQWSYAPNFRVAWIPVPLWRPLGRVESGLLTMSQFPLASALRHQLPGHYSWPVRVFHLKRCLQEIHLPGPDGHDWVIINLHLSAFDQGGRLRRQQMDFLRRLLVERAARGQHLVVGGDWNQAPPGVGPDSFPHRDPLPGWFQTMPADWLPEGFQFAFVRQVPSLRATNKPYRPGENFVTVVDGFVLGPGLQVQQLQCLSLDFEYSDHHPVRLRVALADAAGSTTRPEATGGQEDD